MGQVPVDLETLKHLVNDSKQKSVWSRSIYNIL